MKAIRQKLQVLSLLEIKFFHKFWSIFLSLIEKVAFNPDFLYALQKSIIHLGLD